MKQLRRCWRIVRDPDNRYEPVNFHLAGHRGGTRMRIRFR